MCDPLKEEYYLPSAVDALIHSGRATVKILKTPERWYGVTWQEDKPFVVQAIADMVARGDYPERLWWTAEQECFSKSYFVYVLRQ